MAHEDDCRAGALANVEHEVIEPFGADRVEAGRRFIEKQKRRFSGDGARQAGAFFHAAAQVGRVELCERPELDPFEHFAGPRLAAGCIEFAEHLQRQADVLQQRHR